MATPISLGRRFPRMAKASSTRATSLVALAIVIEMVKEHHERKEHERF